MEETGKARDHLERAKAIVRALPRSVITFHIFRFLLWVGANDGACYYSGSTLRPPSFPSSFPSAPSLFFFFLFFFLFLFFLLLLSSMDRYDFGRSASDGSEDADDFLRFVFESAEIRMHKCISAPTAWRRRHHHHRHYLHHRRSVLPPTSLCSTLGFLFGENDFVLSAPSPLLAKAVLERRIVS